MSAVQTWTLWQRMPPRYQLTTHTFDNDADDFTVIGNATDRTQSPLPRPLSRPVSSGRRSSRPDSRSFSYRETNKVTPRETFRDNFMLSSSDPDPVQREISRALKQKTSKSFSFPKRNSDYVNTFQKQKRVNSARRRLAETPPSPNITSSQQTTEVTSPRAHTAPVFPVTNPENHKEKQPKISETTVPDAKSLRLNLNVKSKTIGEPSKVDMFQFDDSKSVSSTASSVHKSRNSDAKPKKYIVQDTSRATVYIDSGKVMYFGKSRHDLTQLLKTQSLRADRNNCFLAEIRRDYLKHPKYGNGGSSTGKKSENDPRRIANERVDYNRRVEHILNYYDENGINIAKPAELRPTSGQRIKSPKGARVKGLSLTPAAPSRPPSRTPSPDPLDGNSDFIRLNRQLKLHDRQFYLRTPGMQHGNSYADLDKCRCSMCRMELQLALVTEFTARTGLDEAEKEVGAESDKVEKINECDLANNLKGKSCENINSAKKNANAKNNAQKVSFLHPEVDLVAKAQETRFISCTLPEVDEVTASESGFESSRTHDVVSTVPDDIETEL